MNKLQAKHESLCPKCANFMRCHEIVLPAERKAFPILQEAFRKCGATSFAVLNMVYACENFGEV